MKNQIPLDLPPEALILDPFHAPGLVALGPEAPVWSAIPAARLHRITPQNPPLPLPRAIRTATVALCLTDLSLRATITHHGRCLLSGLSGLALLDRIVAQSPTAETALAAHFARQQARPGPRLIPAAAEDLAPGTPCLLPPDAPLLQILSHLCLVARLPLRGPIYLPDLPELRSFLPALFPELAARALFTAPPDPLPRAVVPVNLAPALYQLADADWDAIEHDFPPIGPWQGRSLTRESLALLARHSVDATLSDLRARALAAATTPAVPLPRRFWITRPRPLKGEAALTELLALFGFEPVTLDHLSPLDQVALFAGAEMVIFPPALHLLFAPDTATAISLAADPEPEAAFFAPTATSGCRLLHVQTEADAEGAVLSRLDLARLMSLVVALLDKIPSFQTPEDVQILGSQLIALREHERAQRLFAAHEHLAEGHVGLSLAMADLAELQGDRTATLAHLYTAYRLDPSDWAILIRMLWCARAMNQADLVTTLLETLHDGFPDRFQAFARARPWVRDFYTPPESFHD